MATSATPTPSEKAKFWRAVGRLEGTVTVLVEGQRGLKESHQKRETPYSADLCKFIRRLDQLFYLITGGGAALVATILAARYI